jgi:hypothetical protein
MSSGAPARSGRPDATGLSESDNAASDLASDAIADSAQTS